MLQQYFKGLKNKITPQKAQPTHAEQLAKFRKSWNYIESQFDENERKQPLPSHNNQTEIPHHLKQMVDLLVDEGLRLEDVNTGLCMEEFLRNNVLTKLVKYAKDDVPKDDRFLVHNAVHQPTVALLRMCVHDYQGDRYDEDLVDLMYYICSKIHAFHELLHIFFHDTHWLTTPQKTYLKKESEYQTNFSNNSQDGNLEEDSPSDNNTKSTEATKTTEFTEEPEKPEYEFLLFSYLLQFLHREGKSGEYARYGLLFIIELAVAEGPLSKFILESDFATIMAAGLGALYSQLPRKLMVKSSSGGLTNATLLGFGDNTSAELSRLRNSGIEVSSSLIFKSQLDSFLKLLEFCQDVLNICHSNISKALLGNVKTFFLESILYPSILECSDHDGSAVAVISYIDIIMQTLNQKDLVDVIVGFLMDSDGDNDEFWEKSTAPTASTAPTSKITKRQTINLFEGIDASPIKSSPYFTAEGRFTLKDLIFSRLRSSSQQTVIATLKLLNTVISKHCRFSLKLLNVEWDDNATCFPRPNYLLDDFCNNDSHASFAQPNKRTTISHHLRELDLFFSLISAIDPTQNMEIFTNGYESYVRDAELIIEADTCYICGQDVEWTEEGPTRPNPNKLNKQRLAKCGVRRHRLNPTDRVNPNESLLQILLGTLSNFFAHSPELNLTLTGVLSALAVCPYRSLEGWLVFSGTDRLDRDNRRDSYLRDMESLQHEARNLEISLGIASHDNHTNEDGEDKPINDFDGDDDRSVDYDADKSPSATKAIGATPRWINFPPFFTIFKTLTQQVDYYRSEIEGFDQFLQERRSGLLDAEDEIDENFFSQSKFVSNAPSKRGATSNHSPSPRSRRSTSSASSSKPQVPKRANSLSRSNSTSSSSPLSFKSSAISSSNIVTPLSTHFSKTENIKIQPLFPAHFINEDEEEDSTAMLDDDDDDFAKKQTRTKPKDPKPKEITLSTLLNNVVILEEAVKELVAIVQVRRSLGIDEVRYL
ncbi:4323_t:CDS:2 [Diversispora eburnea]|uniref:4323_t:CDS:1 n=1 Tax=Diversispora eburnea TaxID=1213867 RepID=A0A9N9AF70_9GLOM|nr:4323_t:CDS:2 [Diversispora eburnea]